MLRFIVLILFTNKHRLAGRGRIKHTVALLLYVIHVFTPGLFIGVIHYYVLNLIYMSLESDLLFLYMTHSLTFLDGWLWLNYLNS
jgi:hypothetical protein